MLAIALTLVALALFLAAAWTLPFWPMLAAVVGFAALATAGAARLGFLRQRA